METFITILLLVGGALAMSLQNAFKRGFTKSCPMFFAFTSTFFALVVFVAISGFKFSFDVGLLKYGALMGLAYAVCMVTLTYALKIGHLSLSGLIISASLIMPTFYGIIFLHNPISVCFVIGLVVLAVALVLVNLGGRKCAHDEKSKDEALETNDNAAKKSTVKWVIFIAVAAITNGLTSIIQTAQQTTYGGEKKNEFMIISLAIACVGILVVSLITEHRQIKDGMKQSLMFGAGSGTMNALLNLSAMYSVSRAPAAVVFPVISGAGLVFTFLTAFILFKERFSKIQYIGYALGLISVILLNL